MVPDRAGARSIRTHNPIESDEGMQELTESATYHEDPELDEVKAEDKGLVRDVIAVLAAIQHPNALIKGWVVNPKPKFYEVLGTIDLKAGECEISHGDMEVLKQLDVHRVSPSVVISGQSGQLVVRVTRKSERVMVTEHDIIRIQKRARWWP
jgi:hypothetical protein